MPSVQVWNYLSVQIFGENAQHSNASYHNKHTGISVCTAQSAAVECFKNQCLSLDTCTGEAKPIPGQYVYFSMRHPDPTPGRSVITESTASVLSELASSKWQNSLLPRKSVHEIPSSPGFPTCSRQVEDIKEANHCLTQEHWLHPQFFHLPHAQCRLRIFSLHTLMTKRPCR